MGLVISSFKKTQEVAFLEKMSEFFSFDLKKLFDGDLVSWVLAYLAPL